MTLYLHFASEKIAIERLKLADINSCDFLEIDSGVCSN